MAQYELRKLSRRFGDVRAIDGIDLVVDSGSFVVVLGPTGAGKTTLLRTVAGLETPDAGELWCDGQPITRRPPAERDMAMVFQNFSLYPRKTVYENLAFPLRPRWRRIPPQEIDRRVRWAADLLGLNDKLQSRPTQLSGGQQQRVAIGRAIVREPRLFLFDEPLASLDAKLRESMTVQIHRLQRRLGVTMLYVTHDQIEAMSLADRIVVLDRGRILQAGAPQEIYDRPVSPRVAAMLGSPPINLLDAAQAHRLHLPAAPTVGIRPEHVAVVPDADGPARVIVVEHLGPVSVIVLETQGIRLRATVGPTQAPAAGQRCAVRIDAQRALRWDAISTSRDSESEPTH